VRADSAEENDGYTRQRADQDPLRGLSAQVDLILGMVGEQLGEEHGLHCSDGSAQRRQELKLKVIQQPLHTHESSEYILLENSESILQMCHQVSSSAQHRLTGCLTCSSSVPGSGMACAMYDALLGM
jgi:hypothetical protein